MRIGILTHSYPTTSRERQYAANFIYSFAQILADKVEKVFVFTPDYGGQKEDYKKVPVFWLPLSGDKKKLGYLKPWNPKDIFQLVNFLKTGSDLIISGIKKNKINFCLAMWVFPNGLFALQAKRKLGIGYAAWALGSDLYVYPRYPILRQIIQQILKKADIRFGHGEHMCERVKKLSGLSCHFLPALSRLSFEKQKKAKLDPQKFNFIFLGRLEKIKGIVPLIDAIIDLSSQTKDFNFYILGDGRLKKSLIKKTTKMGLKDNVFFLGNINDKELLAGYYLGADAVVIPSQVECLPLVFTEAMRAKLPMIVSDIGDMSRLVKRYRLGLIFTKEDRRSLVNALKKALQEGKSFKPNHQENMEKVASRFTAEAVVDQFLAELKKRKSS